MRNALAVFCALGALMCLWLALLAPIVALPVLLYLAVWYVYYWRTAWSDDEYDRDYEYD